MSDVLIKTKEKFKKNSNILIPLAGLLVVILVFAILTGGQTLSDRNIRNVINQSVITAIAATGGIFLFSLGMLDISIGAICSVSAIVAVRVATPLDYNVFVMLIVAILVAIVLSLINGTFIAIFKLPSFIVTLTMMNLLAALAVLLVGDAANLYIPFAVVGGLDTIAVKLFALVFMLAVGVFVFNYTRVGRENKIIGGNKLNAELSGINSFRNILISFAISGLSIGIAAMLTIIRTGAVGSTTGASLGFDVIVCVVLGGMPISGGAKSRISAGVIGAFTITVLNNGLIVAGVSISNVQMVRGIIFLGIVTLLSLKGRPKHLI